MDFFTQRYQQSDTPLAYIGGTQRSANFEDSHVWLHPDVLVAAQEVDVPTPTRLPNDIIEIGTSVLRCSPDAHYRDNDLCSKKLLCVSCQLPVCIDCASALERNVIAAV